MNKTSVPNLYLAKAGGEPGKALLAELERFEAEIEQLRRSNAPDIPAVREEKLAELEMRHAAAQAQRATAARAKLEEHRERWEREHRTDPAAALLARERARSFFRAMPDAQLADVANATFEATRFQAGRVEPQAKPGALFDRDEREALLEALDGRSGVDELRILRGVLGKALVEARYTEPWLHDETGRALALEVELAEAPKPGEFAVRGERGEADAGQVFTFGISELLKE